MKKVITILAALAVSVTFAQAADAAADKKADKKGGGTPEEHFKKLDTNSDGSVSLEEFKASPMAQKAPDKAEERFKKMDKDNDGKLTMDEISAGHGKKKDAAAPGAAAAPKTEPAKPASPATTKPEEKK